MSVASESLSGAEGAAAVGVVTGLRAEARFLRGPNLRIGCSGGSSERARAEAARLLSEGAAGLVSFGLAGGLVPDLRPGDLFLSETVRLPEGSSFLADPPWREQLKVLFEKGELRPRGGALVGSEQVVATPAHKHKLRETTGALAVDMESHEVAAIADAARIPFVVVRAIADPYDRVVPQAAFEALRPDGRVRVLAVLGGVIREPGQLLALMRLGRESAAALATLRRAAALAGPDLGYDRRA